MRGAVVVMAMVAGCGFSISVGDNRPADARVDDAMPVAMDAADGPNAVCPPFYHPIGTGMYVVLSPTNFRNHLAACASHGTHLAVIDNAQEAIDLIVFGRTVMDVNMDSRFYIGMVQAPAQTDPELGWIDFQDRAAPDLWAHSGDNEPNDGSDDNENNHQEQVAALQLDRDAIIDLSSGENVRAYCECDGIPVGPKATEFVSDPTL